MIYIYLSFHAGKQTYILYLLYELDLYLALTNFLHTDPRQ